MAYIVSTTSISVSYVELTKIDVCEKGGIVGRGILVDWVCQRNNNKITRANQANS